MAAASWPASHAGDGTGAGLNARKTLVVAGVVAVALSAPGTSRAHEGPATDVLEQRDVFLPLGKPVTPAAARRVDDVVLRARLAGYRIKVAVIGGPVDLGEVAQFWAHPQSYARFVGSLLKLDYHDDLLVVMPAGFGLARAGHDVTRRPLRSIRVRSGSDGLATSAVNAVAALSAASGHPIRIPQRVAVAAPKRADHWLRDRLVIGAVGVMLVLLLAFPAVQRRRAGTARQ